jgi:predicted metal-dependent hydrolase
MDRLRPSLRAGIAVYNAGEYHAAHDAWEDYWLDLPESDDERLLHGLIQFTAAVYHATRGNEEGTTILAGSAREYLAGLPADYRAVNVGAVREWLARLAAAPALPAREDPLALRHEGVVVGYDDLALPATVAAARVLAGEVALDETVIDRAAALAREAGDGEVASLLAAFLAADDRPAAFERLRRAIDEHDRS